ncbi:MAG: class I tRNA ligase family protein, partial [Eubacterium sp.]|nr:class I tRNA ligase family protein [Eubacterium sp.]
TALVTTAKAAAPMIPFMSEDIYQNLVRSVDDSAPISVHLCDFPEVNESQIDTELEDAMAKVLDVVVLGRSCRNASNIKNRQPIGQMFVKADFDLSDFYKEIILDELNVKKVTFTEDVSDFTSYEFKPQLKTVGPKYGKVLGKIQGALKELDGNKAMEELQENGALKFNFDGVDVELTEEDLLISTAQVEGYVSESDNGITVVLDTNLTPELIEEGFVREIISKIQTMRKDNDYDVMDKITFSLKGNDKIKEIVQKNEDMIKNETLTQEVIYDDVVGDEKEWSINGEKVTFGTKR